MGEEMKESERKEKVTQPREEEGSYLFIFFISLYLYLSQLILIKLNYL